MNSGSPIRETGQEEPDLPAERLAYSVDEAAQLTGLSRDLLYDQMRRGNLPYVKIGRRRRGDERLARNRRQDHEQLTSVNRIGRQRFLGEPP
jgi:excisionase family DNA binding protein